MKTITLHFDENIVTGNNNIDEFPRYGGIYIVFKLKISKPQEVWKVKGSSFLTSSSSSKLTYVNDYLYIGQAENIRERMQQHKDDKDINYSELNSLVCYCFCRLDDENDRRAAEAVLIHNCAPKLNVKYNIGRNYDKNSDFVKNGYNQISVVLEDKKHFNPNVFGPMKH